MNTRLIAAAVFACIGMTGAAANADVVSMRFVGTGHGRNVQISTPSSTFSVFAGQLRQNFSNGTGLGAALSGEMITYCTDLTQHVSSTTQSYTILPIASAPVGIAMGADKARAIASIYDYAMGVQLTSGSSDDLACAFQLAVWEIVSDYNYSLGAPSLSMSSGSFRAAQTNGSALWGSVSSLLNSMFAYTNNSSFLPSNIRAVASSTYQDQIVTVPATGPVTLAGVGLGLLAARRRR